MSLTMFTIPGAVLLAGIIREIYGKISRRYRCVACNRRWALSWEVTNNPNGLDNSRPGKFHRSWCRHCHHCSGMFVPSNKK